MYTLLFFLIKIGEYIFIRIFYESKTGKYLKSGIGNSGICP